MVTPQQLRETEDVNVLIGMLEKATGERMPTAIGISLAMAHGAARSGGSITVIDLGEGSWDETPNYEQMAEIINRDES